MHKKCIPILIIFLLLLVVACSLGAKPQDSMSLTLTPLSAAVEGTATARVSNVGGTGDQLATAVAKATARSADIYATQTARASLNSESRMATATAIAPVVAELPRYSVDPTSGEVAWMHPPVTIDLNGYQQPGYANDYGQVTAKDFVLAADITWYTYNSLSACGFMFRSDGDQNKPNGYMVFITRFASGHLAFTATVDGDISNVRTYFPKDEDNSFSWFNNATNRLAIVARGTRIDVYTNGVLIGEVDTTQPPPSSLPSPPSLEPPEGATPEQLQDYQDQIDQNSQTVNLMQAQLAEANRNYAKNKAIFSDGLLGFLGVSQSGHTICTFDNAWLFLIER
ncbi:MAG: hypothetical protein MUO30_00835 [Anaerolineales bacterium]|nr:hypothetical protein [Anaerolineales bacterium]